MNGLGAIIAANLAAGRETDANGHGGPFHIVTRDPDTTANPWHVVRTHDAATVGEYPSLHKARKAGARFIRNLAAGRS